MTNSLFDTLRSFGGGVSRAATLLAVAAALALPAAAFAQDGTVTGTVTDAASQRPVGSAQVHLVGTGLGTLSRDNGRFVVLNVPAGEYTLRAERIGYTTMDIQITVAAGATLQQDFSIASQPLGLDEIVVTGTAGAARRREIGSTISQLDVDAQVVGPPTNVDALLQARVPGMSVTQSSASSGGGAMIRLRGNVSMTQSNQPLIYIDGVRVRSAGFAKNVPPIGYSGRSNNDVSSPLNSVNPQDIERVEVIKGAAATTLYGTEASAGVIQIFTKRGSIGEATWTGPFGAGAFAQPDLRPRSLAPASVGEPHLAFGRALRLSLHQPLAPRPQAEVRRCHRRGRPALRQRPLQRHGRAPAEIRPQRGRRRREY